MANVTDLSPMDLGLDTFWAAKADDFECRPISVRRVVKTNGQPHSNADTRRAFSMIHKIKTEHRSEFAKESIAGCFFSKDELQLKLRAMNGRRKS